MFAEHCTLSPISKVLLLSPRNTVERAASTYCYSPSFIRSLISLNSVGGAQSEFTVNSPLIEGRPQENHSQVIRLDSTFTHAPVMPVSCLHPLYSLIHFSFSNCPIRFMDAHRNGLKGEQAVWAGRKYQSPSPPPEFSLISKY